MITHIFTYKPYLYFFLLVVGILLYSYLFFRNSDSKFRAFPFVVLFGVLLFARLPVILSNIPLNPDESMQLAQAITIKKAPVVFDGWDGNTIGPLDTYLIMLPHGLGFPLEYTTLHLMAMLCQFLFVWLVYQTIKIGIGRKTAFWSTLPIILWFVFTQHPDFLHYSSEQPPIVLLAASNYIYFLVQNEPKKVKYWLFLQGMLTALVPFAKLQAVPLAIVIVGFTVLSLLRQPAFLRKFAMLLAGGMSVLIIFGIGFFYFGVIDDFWIYYLEGNLFHEAGGATASITERFLNHFNETLQLTEFRASLLYMGAFMIYFFLKNYHKSVFYPPQYIIFTGIMVLAAVFAVSKSGFRLYHYNHLLLLPMALVVAAFAIKFRPNLQYALIVSSLTLLLFTFPILGKAILGGNFYDYGYPNRTLRISEVSKAIKKYANKGEYLGVWGWMQDYFVETQMPQATNDNHTIRCFTYSMVKHHRTRYMNDLMKTKPPVFIDAVASSSFLMTDKDEFGMHHFPELDNYIRENYVFMESVNENAIYLRKDLAKKK